MVGLSICPPARHGQQAKTTERYAPDAVRGANGSHDWRSADSDSMAMWPRYPSVDLAAPARQTLWHPRHGAGQPI
jgi:hypothetical protein